MYMNVTEVQSAMIALASNYPSICELITLPNNTIEGRTTHAVRIGKKPATDVDIFYLTGGVHAREWGSCEILVNLATDLCEKYTAAAGLGYGGKIFSAAEVKAIVEQMNIIIFACVNPDGRNYSQTTDDWRKNRNPADSGGDALKIGVDINRNQDFLWDLNAGFDPAAINDYLASTNPGADTYHGHAPVSEAETKNINWIHDHYPRIRWYIDVHSYSEDILYAWGDDESQITDPAMNFTNAAYNGKRGIAGDAYREYIPDADESMLIGLANAFKDTLFEVRKKVYVAKPAFGLYATSGTNDDYAFSRHIADPSKGKVYGYTIEWGTTFQPLWPEMQEIIKDVDAGIIGFGLKAMGIGSFIVTDRDTFSSYELESTSNFPASFYVMYDGFAPSTLGAPGAHPTAVFRSTIGGAAIGTIHGNFASVQFENPGALDSVQRMTFTFDVHFDDATAFTAETRDIILEVSFAGIQDIATIHLIKQPNPYMSDGPVTWLSTDLRVFQLKKNQKVHTSSTTTMGDANTDPNAPYTYIQNLLTELRGYGNALAPPFENISVDQGTSQLELSRTVSGERVLNFAVAKVRFRANSVDATDVRVFFRTFNTMVSDLSYTLDGGGDLKNYRRTGDGKTALLGYNKAFSGFVSQIVSIPYFAEKRINSASVSMTTQPDGFNKHTIVHAAGQEAYMYFGCWLDFNQSENQFPTVYPNSDGPFASRVPIPQLVRGIHQCLVAEIRYQPGATDPISIGQTPSQSDRLAQRNLAIVESDNPGDPSTHVVQHTLYVKPSKVENKTPGAAAQRVALFQPLAYDELVIRWNNLPRDTKVEIYFPEWNVDEVIRLAAASHQSPFPLTKVDSHTIGCTVSDITYIPVPSISEKPYAGLLTLQLPEGVKVRQKFAVDVQQHTGLVQRREVPVNSTVTALATNPKTQLVSISKRKVLGAFTLSVVVKMGEDMLPRAVRNLAVLRYIQLAIPANDPWYPVFTRYINQVADKVRGLGVDPDLVEPSLDDPGLPGVYEPGKGRCVTGKVCEVIYDGNGVFEGFVLRTSSGRHTFRSNERAVGRIVQRACKERRCITVCVDNKTEKISRIVEHCKRWFRLFRCC